MKSTLNKIMIYAKDMQKMSLFYEKYFDYKAKIDKDERIIELSSAYGGSTILIHQAGKGVKEGQACIKLVFDVKNVEKFRDKYIAAGLKFGSVHEADGYSFSNAKDPGKNTIQISSRAFRKNV